MEIHTLNLALDCMCEDHAINGVHVVLRFGFSEHVHFSCRADHIVIASFFVNTKIVSPHPFSTLLSKTNLKRERGSDTGPAMFAYYTKLFVSFCYL